MLFFDRIFRPEIYQGRNQHRDYFEGWYYKQVSDNQKHAISFIPGVSLDKNDPHAFIQAIISSPALKTAYFRFPLSQFSYQDEPFQIQIGQSIFTKRELQVSLKNECLQIEGHLKFGEFNPIHRSLAAPNIMGFFGYLNFMECYHAIISMQHQVSGEMTVDDCPISFGKGVGYIEKDWGISFPKEYIWVQCNHFQDENTSFMLSVAHIPFMGKAFKGFICNVRFQGKELRFATYNRGEILTEEIFEKSLRIQIKRKGLTLEVEAEILDNINLVAPKNGKMVHTIKEGLSGEVKIKLIDQCGKVFYEDLGTSAGVEIVI